jgi:aryl-alcohol dehydrogenase-like predicted oxidoreductase
MPDILHNLRNFNELVEKAAAKPKLPQRELGKTGVKVGILSLGGQGALETQRKDRKEQVAIVRRAYELGINYFDSSPIYGPSLEIYGEALKGIRSKVFMASKTHLFTRDGALKLLEKTLKTLNTDYLDLWQLHNLTTKEEIDKITAKDGALSALTEMRDQGVVSYLGFTGHECPKVLSEMSRRFDFDTALCALNAADKHVKPSFIDDFLPAAKAKRLGIIGMKVFSQGYIFHPKGITTPWEALTYAMSLPISTVIVGCDSVAQLEENVAIAKTFEQLTEDEMREIELKTRGYVKRAQFFRKKFGGYASRDKLGKPFTVLGRKP